MRYLTWHIDPIGPGAGQGESYMMDRDYDVSRVWVRLGRAPTAVDAPLTIDINVDGVSIFTVRPSLIQSETEQEEDRAFVPITIGKDSVITLDVDEAAGGNMMVGLELEEA